jgi:Nidogen-like
MLNTIFTMRFQPLKVLIVPAVAIVLTSWAVAQSASPLTITKPALNTYKLEWSAGNLRPYQMQTSADLLSWLDFGGVIIGTGTSRNVVITTTTPELFFRLRNPVIREGFHNDFVPAWDDNSSLGAVGFGFTINLFGNDRTECWVNNNGNITFTSSLGTYTPQPMQGLGFHIIAPFWADVDTSAADDDPPLGKVTTYGAGTANGRPAFGVNWSDVGYYESHTDKLNNFQLVLIERNDTGLKNFDIEFNYSRILWETGDASNGFEGYGGTPVRVGITDGANKTVELAYSGQQSLQLDRNPATNVANTSTGLIYRSRNSTLPGRFIFQIRSGQIVGALNVNAGVDQNLTSGTNSAALAGTASNPIGGAITVKWSVFESIAGISGVTFSNPAILNPIVFIPASEDPLLILTVTSVADPSISATDIVMITH